ncbi:MAG TPA: hypothetical protein VJ508_11270, partial [Saprospiraceae bacterium]|nr:hypothetical protein [Saprospiraceae bacterium]
SWAADQGGNNQGGNNQGGNNQGGNNQGGNNQNQAPEIDVGAGGAGLTVLAIALLLAAERRSRSS